MKTKKRSQDSEEDSEREESITTLTIISILSLAISLIFLSSFASTGFVIADMPKSNTGFVGSIFFIIGIIGLFAVTRISTSQSSA
jgi:hypothetical protein